MASETFPQHALATWLQRVHPDTAFRALADLQAEAAIFAVDADRNIVYWSPGAEKVLGFRADEVEGRHCLTGSRCLECMGGCGLTEYGTVTDRPLSMYRSDGSIVRLRKTARAFTDDEGNFLGGIELLVPDGAADPSRRTLLPSRADGEEFHGILTRDRKMQDVFRIIRNVAETEATVLLRGESGTGKELVARAVHNESSRRDKPFLAINCAAMSANLLESELFGHERGAFTGAHKEHKGVFERAHGGTLFLDEVAEMPLELQSKLLRVIQERSFFRVGGSTQVSVDVRILSATHRSLREAVAAGRFREDLMYRLRVVPIFIPSLRERKLDIPLILQHYIHVLNERGQRQVQSVSPEAMRALLDHDWPGNVRELLNVLEYAFAVGRGAELDCIDLPPELRRQNADIPAGLAPPSTPSPLGSGEQPAPAIPPSPLSSTLADEPERIRKALSAAGGNVGKAAESLGMSRPTFWRKRKKYGL